MEDRPIPQDRATMSRYDKLLLTIHPEVCRFEEEPTLEKDGRAYQSVYYFKQLFN